MASQVAHSSPNTCFYIKSPIVDVLDKWEAIIWRVETPNRLIEAKPYEERIGAVVTRYLNVVNPPVEMAMPVEEKSWMNCTNYVQQAQELTPDHIQLGEELSDDAYIKLVYLTHPNFPLPSLAPYIIHIQHTEF